MRYPALAMDYDGTLAHHGHVAAGTMAALTRAKASGRKLILVTGRELEELMVAIRGADVFDAIVAENGALLYTPSPPRERPLSVAPPTELVQALRDRGIAPLTQGRIVISTIEPNEQRVLATIRDLGLEMELFFNRGSVLLLPSGVSKGTGVVAACAELGLSPSRTIGIGDGENDHSLLAACGLGVAVGDAVPSLRRAADVVTRGRGGEGVIEIVDRLLASDPLHGGRFLHAV